MMNLRHIRLLHEDDNAYHLHDTKKGERFKVQKKGLSKGTVTQIAQHFAKGGPVEDFERAPEKLSEEPTSSFVGPLSASQYIANTDPVLERPMAMSPERLASFVQERLPAAPPQAMAQAPAPGPAPFVGPLTASQYVGGMDPVLTRPMAMSPDRLLSFYRENLPPPSAQPMRQHPSNFIQDVPPEPPVRVAAKMMRPHFVTPPASEQPTEPDMLEVRGRDGKKFKASKKHLKPTTVAMMQRFADGGEVETSGLPPGYETFLAASGADPSLAAGVQPQAPLMPGQIPQGYAALLSGMGASALPGGAPPQGPVPSGPGQNMSPIPAPGFTPMPQEPAPTPGQPAAPQAPVAAPRAGGGGGGGMSAQDRAISEAAGMESKAVQQQADIAGRVAEQTLALQQKHQAEHQATMQQWEQRYQANQSRADALTQEMANSKIDPQHFWNSRSTGQRIAGTIALMLGGIGQAFGGGPNPALALLNSAIERDIEAQKAELGKKGTLLSHYIQQGHSIREAQQLVRADLADGFAGQLQMVATKNAGPEAQAKAAVLQAGIKKQAFQERLAAHEGGLKLALGGLQLQQGKQAMQMQQAQMGALAALANGQPITPQVAALLPEHMQKRIVSRLDGSIGIAQTDKEAEDYRKSQRELKGLKSNIRAMMQLETAHPHGVSEVLSRDDYGRAEEIYYSTLTKFNKLEELNRFTHNEAEIFSKRLNDVRKFKFSNSGDIAKLRAIAEEIDQKVAADDESLLGGAPRGKPNAAVVRE